MASLCVEEILAVVSLELQQISTGGILMDDYLDTYIVQLLESQQYRNGIFARRSLKDIFLSLSRRRLKT